MYEAFEETVAHRRRYAGPLVLHVDVHELIGGVHAHVHRAARGRMLERVVEQIQHQTVQQHAIAMHAQFIREICFVHLQRHPTRFGQRSHAVRRGPHELGDGHVAMLSDETARIHARQQEQVVHDAREAHGLILNHVQRLAVFRLVAGAAPQGDIGLTADDRNRCTQFVRGICHELPLRAERIAHASQQAVDDLGEPTQLVVRIHDLQAIIEIGRCDAGGAHRNLVERSETAAGQRVAGDDRGQQRQRNGQQQRVPHGTQQQAITLKRVQHSDQQRWLARVLRHRCQTRNTGPPVYRTHANRTHRDLALVGDLGGACLHDVAQQRAHFIGQEDRVIDGVD